MLVTLSYTICLHIPSCTSVCLSVRLSVRLSVCLSVCMSICLYVCLCVYCRRGTIQALRMKPTLRKKSGTFVVSNNLEQSSAAKLSQRKKSTGSRVTWSIGSGTSCTYNIPTYIPTIYTYNIYLQHIPTIYLPIYLQHVPTIYLPIYLQHVPTIYLPIYLQHVYLPIYLQHVPTMYTYLLCWYWLTYSDIL